MAFQLAQFHITAIRESPYMLGLVVSGIGSVHGAEKLPAYQLVVGQALVGAPQVQDARLLAVLLDVTHGQQRQRVGLATTTTTTQKEVQFLGDGKDALLKIV